MTSTIEEIIRNGYDILSAEDNVDKEELFKDYAAINKTYWDIQEHIHNNQGRGELNGRKINF